MKSHRGGRPETTRLSHRATPARESPALDSLQCGWLETCAWRSEDDHADNSLGQLPRSLRPTLSLSPRDGVPARGQWHAQSAEKTVLRRIEKSCRPTALPAID